MWEWSRKRTQSRAEVLRRGAIIGALGGLLFAALMLYGMTRGGGTFEINEDATGPILGAIANALGPTGFLFLLSVPAFTGLGAWLSGRVWQMMERRYQLLLQAGERVPLEAPYISSNDRLAKWAIIGGFALLCLGLFGMLIWEINRGAL